VNRLHEDCAISQLRALRPSLVADKGKYFAALFDLAVGATAPARKIMIKISLTGVWLFAHPTILQPYPAPAKPYSISLLLTLG
jgi:hypothetical protein